MKKRDLINLCFGPATEKAVRSFQTTAALEPDGKIGADTWTALLTA
ncbi:MAG: peptidoglycan-binding protein [Oscillospiraceae bacterium]|nr:peptidoglycan-binding protein [Oscillospiraceae bacterium]